MPEDCTTDCAVSSTIVAIAVGSPERIDPSACPASIVGTRWSRMARWLVPSRSTM